MEERKFDKDTNKWFTIKQQITSRDYIKLLQTRRDPNKNRVNKVRQSFIFKQQFFIIDTVVSVEGYPCILRIETENHPEGGNSKIEFPPFINIVREVTDEVKYDTFYMADIKYVMDEKDK